MEGGRDPRLVGQTGVLGLDGVRMLVGVAAVVVATGVPATKPSFTQLLRKKQTKKHSVLLKK